MLTAAKEAGASAAERIAHVAWANRAVDAVAVPAGKSAFLESSARRATRTPACAAGRKRHLSITEHRRCDGGGRNSGVQEFGSDGVCDVNDRGAAYRLDPDIAGPPLCELMERGNTAAAAAAATVLPGMEQQRTRSTGGKIPRIA